MQMRWNGKCILLAMSVALSSLLWTGTALAEQPVLRVGVTYEMQPRPNHNRFDVARRNETDYMQILAAYAGMQVQFVPGSMSENMARIENGEIDVLAGLSYTPERGTRLDYARLPMGYADSILYLRGGTGTFEVGKIQPLRIGRVRSEYQSELLPSIMNGEGAGFVPMEFPDLDAMVLAYDNESIDGFCVSGRAKSPYPATAEFDMSLLYFTVKKGNTELLDRLNQASDWLMIARPDFMANIYQRRVEESGGAPLIFVPDERQYLLAHHTLRPIVIANGRPYAYVGDDGQIAGALRVVLDRMAGDLGIEMEPFIVSNEDAAIRALREGDGDFVMNVAWDAYWGSGLGLNLTAPYQTAYFMGVTRRTGIHSEPVVAALDNPSFVSQVQHLFPGWEIRKYPTYQACLQAVRQGKADITYVRQEMAQYELLRGNYPDLVMSGRIAMQRDIAMGVQQTADPVLLRVLDKEIRHMGRNITDSFFAEETQRVLNERSATSYLYSYPQYAMGGVGIIAAIVALAFWRYRRMKKRNVARLQSVIDHDQHTGLHNADWLERMGERLLAQRKSDGIPHFIAVVHIVRSDIINGMYGRESVIGFFQQLAREVKQREHVELIGVRTAAAELVILLRGMDHEMLQREFTKLLKQNEYLKVGDMLVRVALEVGICSLDNPPADIRTAINNANLAAHGADPIRFYNRSLQEDTMLTSRMESLQESALQREEFQVWYQPKYNLETRQCVGAEALVRWESEELGFLSPGKFIPLFEGNGFISQLDFYNLERVMQFQREAKEKGLPVRPISVNQSRVHMREQGYLAKMQALVDTYSTEGIELELTETAFDVQGDSLVGHSISVVDALHRMGFAIDMDDFGSGYSDLSLLNKLPLDVMKIDRSLLLTSEGSERMAIVLRQMIDLGHALGMKIICEGIETPEQEDLLRRCGCEYGQGFLYGKPMRRADYEAFLAAHA